jgi:hypothetical protein
MSRYVRIVTDNQSAQDITAGVRFDIDGIDDYKVLDGLSLKIVSVSGIANTFVFSNKDNMLKLLNYLDTQLSVNLSPL